MVHDFFFTKRGAQIEVDKRNIDRDPGPWRVEGPVSGRKLKRYTIVFDRPENY